MTARMSDVFKYSSTSVQVKGKLGIALMVSRVPCMCAGCATHVCVSTLVDAIHLNL